MLGSGFCCRRRLVFLVSSLNSLFTGRTTTSVFFAVVVLSVWQALAYFVSPVVIHFSGCKFLGQLRTVAFSKRATYGMGPISSIISFSISARFCLCRLPGH